MWNNVGTLELGALADGSSKRLTREDVRPTPKRGSWIRLHIQDDRRERDMSSARRDCHARRRLDAGRGDGPTAHRPACRQCGLDVSGGEQVKFSVPLNDRSASRWIGVLNSGHGGRGDHCGCPYLATARPADAARRSGSPPQERINEPGHFVGPDPPVYSLPIEPGHLPPRAGPAATTPVRSF